MLRPKTYFTYLLIFSVNNKCDDIIIKIKQLRSFLLDKLMKEKSEKMDKLISQLKNFDNLEVFLTLNF